MKELTRALVTICYTLFDSRQNMASCHSEIIWLIVIPGMLECI